jgi:hypothetical protein
VTAAGMQDRDSAHRLLALLREHFSTITLVVADGGYAGHLVTWAKAVLHLTISIVKRTDDTTGVVVLPRRCVAERTLGWLTATDAWSETTNADQNATKPWSGGPPSPS